MPIFRTKNEDFFEKEKRKFLKKEALRNLLMGA